jgi:hypothetical protein
LFPVVTCPGEVAVCIGARCLEMTPRHAHARQTTHAGICTSTLSLSTSSTLCMFQL